MNPRRAACRVGVCHLQLFLFSFFSRLLLSKNVHEILVVAVRSINLLLIPPTHYEWSFVMLSSCREVFFLLLAASSETAMLARRV
jgi:hypothetical protein